MDNIKLIRFKDYAKGKRVAVIGIGISNRPLIKWLNAIGMDIVAFDRLEENDPAIKAVKEEFTSENIKVTWSLGEGYLEPLKNEKFSFVFKTPKMRVETPELQEAVKKGAVLTSEMELFIDLCPATIFGITGSDGKTTTTTLVSEILKHAGYSSRPVIMYSASAFLSPCILENSVPVIDASPSGAKQQSKLYAQ